MEIRQRYARLHYLSEAHVVGMGRIVASIPVDKRTIGGNLIVVWARDTRRNGHRKNHGPGFEDALGSDKPYPVVLKDKSFSEKLAWQYFTVQRYLFCQPAKGAITNSGVLFR